MLGANVLDTAGTGSGQSRGTGDRMDTGRDQRLGGSQCALWRGVAQAPRRGCGRAWCTGGRQGPIRQTELPVRGRVGGVGRGPGGRTIVRRTGRALLLLLLCVLVACTAVEPAGVEATTTPERQLHSTDVERLGPALSATLTATAKEHR